MAKLSNSILGPLSGKIGPVISSSWKGIPYLKSAHEPRTKKISAREKANRQKFKLAQEWLTPLLLFVREGFKGYTPTVEGFVAAKSYLMKNALETRGAEFWINPAKMKVSFGTLPLSENITVKPTDDFQLQFAWDSAEVEGGLDKDQVMLLAYDIEHERMTYTTASEFRGTGSAVLPAPCRKGAKCHVYVAFVSVDRSRQSDSVYLGEIKW